MKEQDKKTFCIVTPIIFFGLLNHMILKFGIIGDIISGVFGASIGLIIYNILKK